MTGIRWAAAETVALGAFRPDPADPSVGQSFRAVLEVPGRAGADAALRQLEAAGVAHPGTPGHCTVVGVVDQLADDGDLCGATWCIPDDQAWRQVAALLNLREETA